MSQDYRLVTCSHVLGSDMRCILFIQEEGNEKALKKFEKINKIDDCIFFGELYAPKDILVLSKFKSVLYSGCADNEQWCVLKGKLKIKGRYATKLCLGCNPDPG